MDKAQDLFEMYRTHPLVNSILTSLHLNHPRSRLRNFALTVLALLSIYSLYHITPFSDRLSFAPHEDVPFEVWEQRAEEVKKAFLHGFHGYEAHAVGHDELLPISGSHKDPFNGWGVAVYDGLDTMLLMGLDDEYKRSLQYIENSRYQLEDACKKHAPYFETVIRYLGGLLSSYALSKNPMLLERAEELAEKLDNAFNTSSGFPLYGVNPSTGETVGPEVGILAEIASLQLEYTYLAKATGKMKFYERANTVMQNLYNANLDATGGMLPKGWSVHSAKPVDAILTVGAQADSAHEYLLKQYLLTAKSDRRNLEMYLRATTHIINNLLYVSPTRQLLYVTDTTYPTYEHRGRPSHIFEHLSCFLPGLLALGAHTLPLDNLSSMGINLADLGGHGQFGDASQGYERLAKYNLRDLHMWAAEGLAETCYITYADMPTGLGPDEVMFKTSDSRGFGKQQDGTWLNGGGELWIDAVDTWKRRGRGMVPGTGDKKKKIYSEKERLTGSGTGRDYTVKKSAYLLRPETVESLYILWKVTGDVRWREKGWEIFKALELQTKTEYGYASLRSVEYLPPPKMDDMPSYVFAETWKYLYLLFTNADPLPLDEWVFNTEAHPLPVFEW